ncbi:Alpha/Beta hydrolase protein [Chytridium lagenaria]|nr:Alpha/Beta hydrolase protein [Chytridium lagenaria]
MPEPEIGVTAASDFRANFKKPAGYDKLMAAQRVVMADFAPQPGAQDYMNQIVEMEAQLPTMISEVFGPRGPGGGKPDIYRPVLQRRGGSSPVIQGSGPSVFTEVLSQYASFSAAAYCSKESLLNWNCATCKNKASGTVDKKYVLTISFVNCNRYVGYNTKLNTIIVSYRGSQNIQNWIQNLAFIRVDADVPNAPSGVSVHFGFQNTWNAVADDVTPAVTALLKKYPSATVSITGHSLGGAVATMSAIGLVQSGTVIASRAFYIWVLGFAQVLRGVNYNDLVPHLPPTPLGFRHHLEQQWIDSTGRTNYCDDLDAKNAGEDTNCANSTFPWYSTAPHVSYFGSSMGGADC